MEQDQIDKVQEQEDEGEIVLIEKIIIKMFLLLGNLCRGLVLEGEVEDDEDKEGESDFEDD